MRRHAHAFIKYDRLNMQRPYKSHIWFLLLLHPRCMLLSLPHLLILWHLMHKATQGSTHTENTIRMSPIWPWGEVSNISFQGNNDSSFNRPYFTVCPNEYTACVILIERQPASGIMTLTVLSRFDDLMTMDLLIYAEICSSSFIINIISFMTRHKATVIVPSCSRFAPMQAASVCHKTVKRSHFYWGVSKSWLGEEKLPPSANAIKSVKNGC